MENEKTGDLLENRREKIAELISQGINPYPNRFRVHHTVADILQ
jgi:lysyl-tRNA synthetase class II